MKPLHHTQQVKHQQMRIILSAIYTTPNKEAMLDKLKIECFDKHSLPPATVDRYLAELEELGKIEVLKEENKVVANILEE